MKKYLEIIKWLGIIFLLFISVCVASDDSDDTHTVSVTITQLSASEKGEDPIANNYEKEITTTGSTDVQVKGDISGKGASLTTNLGDMTTNTDDTTTPESDDPVGMPEFKIGESPDKFTEELSLWISLMIDNEDLLINMNDFPDISDMTNEY